jgi:hypothetical protein
METWNHLPGNTVTLPALIALKIQLPGKVILPDHPEYLAVRRIWNGYIDLPGVGRRLPTAGAVLKFRKESRG